MSTSAVVGGTWPPIWPKMQEYRLRRTRKAFQNKLQTQGDEAPLLNTHGHCKVMKYLESR
eukprot:4383982-Prorocentrum_lima.AAC.1